MARLTLRQMNELVKFEEIVFPKEQSLIQFAEHQLNLKQKIVEVSSDALVSCIFQYKGIAALTTAITDTKDALIYNDILIPNLKKIAENFWDIAKAEYKFGTKALILFTTAPCTKELEEQFSIYNINYFVLTDALKDT